MSAVEKVPGLSETIRLVRVADLVPYARNTRTHPPFQVKQIADSIDEFGFVGAIVIRDGVIAKGHGTLAAVQRLQGEGRAIYPAPGRHCGAAPFPSGRVPVQDCTGWDDARFRAYVIADNKIALNSGWDMDLLALELGDLRAGGLDLGLTGFSHDELLDMLGDAVLPDPDEAIPDVESAVVTVSGDVWIMGRHRVICGDSTDPETIANVTGGRLASICFTSPPYAQQRDYTGGISDWDALMRGVFGAAPLLPDAQVLVNLGLVHREGEWLPYWEGWIEWMRAQQWRRFGWYVWDQGPGLPGDWNGRLAPSHEFVFHFNRQARNARKTKAARHAGQILGGGGLRSADGSIQKKSGAGKAIQRKKIPDSVIRVAFDDFPLADAQADVDRFLVDVVAAVLDRVELGDADCKRVAEGVLEVFGSSRVADSVARVMRHKGGLGKAGKHPAPFPVALPEEFLTAFSAPDDVAWEPFVGSGSQIIAGQKTGRTVYGCELAPEYTDVAVRRWQIYTQQSAVLESTGKTFDEMQEARCGRS